jgi:SAM-dependent methyltransferase
MLNTRFVQATDDLVSRLQTLKDDGDLFDQGNPTTKETTARVDATAAQIFPRLDEYFDLIWRIAEQLDKESYTRQRRYAQEKLVPFFTLSPLNKRIFEKPFGYDGDFLTISFYYDNKYEGDSTFAKLMHRYTLSIPLARAVRARIGYFNRLAGTALKRFGNNLSFTSIGSGPGREIIEFISQGRTTANITFNCLDFDERALARVAAETAGLQRKHPNLQIKLHYSSVLKFLHDRPSDKLAGQHLIYSFGLFDYLKERTAVKLVNDLTGLLAPGGQLVVSNFADTVPHQGFLHFLGNWELILRSEKEMGGLAAGAAEIRLDPETKTNYYLTAIK